MMKNIFSKYKVQLCLIDKWEHEVSNIISTPKNIVDVATKVLEINLEAEEVLYLLTLDTKNTIIGIYEVSRGTINASMVHPREIIKRTFLNNANGIILMHNHISNNPSPSKYDIEVTTTIDEICKLIKIDFIDHVIIANDGSYKSLLSEGYIEKKQLRNII